MPNTPEQLRVVLEEIIATPTENEFVTFEITDVAPIAVAKNMPVSVHHLLHTSRIQEHLSALISALAMSSCLNRKSEKFQHSLTISFLRL